MVSFTFASTATVLSTLTLLVQGTQSYCIYNYLKDETGFDVSQAFSRAQDSKNFKKWMPAYTKECCPYTDGDCSFRKINNDVAQFFVTFHWPRYTSGTYTIKCTTGGGLAIYGTENDHWAECTDAFGNTTRIDIFPDSVTN